MSNYRQKAPFNDWWYWSDVLGKRLRTIADVYRENDEKERAQEIAAIAKKLYDLFIGPARKGQKAKTMKPEEKAALAKEEEAAIFDACNVWRDTLNNLPFISQTVEGFLNLQWSDIDPNPKSKGSDNGEVKTEDSDKAGDAGKGDKGSSGSGAAGTSAQSGIKKTKIDPRAVELFWGPKGRYDEGIRSGLPKDGGLPGILMNYLMAEKSNSNRSPTDYKDDKAYANSYGSTSVLNVKPPGMGGM
ncbi:MAG: hypothetical protein AB7G06_07515 [Bdellovibrionales bacterium]